MTALSIGAALIAGLLVAYWAGRSVGLAKKESQIVGDSQEARRRADEIFRDEVPRTRRLVSGLRKLRNDDGPTV